MSNQFSTPSPLLVTPCLFCDMGDKKNSRVLHKFKHCYVIKDNFPVSKGHLLIIPYIHTENWFTASTEIRFNIMEALELMKKYLDEEFHPDGYNFGVNCGKAAGQTIFHLHMHLIPRYKGDMSDPKGGIRGVIPQKQKY